MELDEMKLAWKALDRRLDQQNALSLQLFRDGRMDKLQQGGSHWCGDRRSRC